MIASYTSFQYSFDNYDINLLTNDVNYENKQNKLHKIMNHIQFMCSKIMSQPFKCLGSLTENQSDFTTCTCTM